MRRSFRFAPLLAIAAALVAGGLLVNHQASVPAPTIEYTPTSRCSGLVTIAENDKRPGVTVQVTLDGGDPINTGWSYRHPFTGYAPITIKARGYDPVNGFSPLVAKTIDCAPSR